VVLQNVQEFGLQGGVHFTDFVKENGATVGLFELAELLPCRARECPRLVAEQLTLQQFVRNGRAVDLHERFVAARRFGVNHARNHFLAGSAFAANQDRGGGIGDLLDGGFHLHHSGAGAEQHGKVAAPPHLFAKLMLVLKYFGKANIQFSYIHGFAEVIVSTQPRRSKDHFRISAGREHDYRNRWLELLELPQNIGSGHILRREIEQHQHWIKGAKGAESFWHSGSYGYVKVVPGEMRDQVFSSNYVIIHDQYTGLLAHRCLQCHCGPRPGALMAGERPEIFLHRASGTYNSDLYSDSIFRHLDAQRK